MLRYVKYRKIYYIFSGLLILLSIASIAFFGLKLGIDFTGGSILEIEYLSDRPSNSEIQEKLSGLDLGSLYIQPTGEKGVILRMKDIDETTHRAVVEKLGETGQNLETPEGVEIETSSAAKELRFESIGPVIGKELRQKTKIVVVLALLAMGMYIALAFRRVQRPLKSWQYGIATIIALFHDIIIPLGILAVLGKFYSVEISISIVTALLTVVGSSINNTVVVFDRIRENLIRSGGFFEEIVDRSLNQTLSRQINTSLAVLIGLFCILFFGGETLRYFSLTLILGIVVGAYSSFFIAGPILVSWFKLREKKFTTI